MYGLYHMTLTHTASLPLHAYRIIFESHIVQPSYSDMNTIIIHQLQCFQHFSEMHIVMFNGGPILQMAA